MNDPKVKQQIADKIRDASNILVTVSKNPSVDELSAALGLTLLLNKMDKHATAIFSGQTPPAITFLEPDKTFEGTTDSLRDFIIALDKEKADHLRYKLEGDLVKIYITPYRNTITSDDLEFSQGDYNVELVIALGVEDKDNLDEALDGHGKILHDATVITLTAGEQTSNLGSVDWHDANASSLSEMLTSLYESMKLDKKLLDQSIATAFLTGIVSATERFSNPRTSSRVMTIAATLMAAGADQQLIAAQLEEAAEEPEIENETDNSEEIAESKNGEVVLAEGESTKLKEDKPAPTKKRANGELVINHQKEGTLEEVAEETTRERLEESARAAERALEKQEEAAAAIAPPPVQQPVAPPAGAVDFTPSNHQGQVATSAQEAPMLGGTLNATSEQAEEDKRREIERDKNKVILSHSYLGGSGQPTYNSSINSVSAGEGGDEAAIDVFAAAPTAGLSSEIEPASAPTVEAPAITPPSESVATLPEPVIPEPTPEPEPSIVPPPPVIPSAPTLADIDAQNRTPQPSPEMSHDEARAAIDAAFAASPIPEVPPLPPAPEAPAMPDLASIGLPLPPPLPEDFSAGLPSLPPTSEPERLGDILTTDSAELPQVGIAAAPQPTASSDPGQFRIPGQG
ncbi:MAG TPA: hypothetical protein PKD28_01340 [Candidatus Saccharibacteria bacterium]|nr:hypothetical protein [Candidatus Saccharibacteria bacterium]